MKRAQKQKRGRRIVSIALILTPRGGWSCGLPLWARDRFESRPELIRGEKNEPDDKKTRRLMKTAPGSKVQIGSFNETSASPMLTGR
jgi:hypothetical protein